MILLADTHVLIWWLGDSARLSRGQRRRLAGIVPESPLLVSDITLWEIAMLHQKARVSLALPLREWLERAVAPPLVKVSAISPAIAVEAASLPDTFHGDPADRIIVSTARLHGATLLTSDRRIIESGLVRVQV